MPLARSLAVQYRHAREPLEDLCQVANLGLVKAVDRFDPDRGIAFTSYAVPTILGELKRHFRDRTWAIHVSRGMQESIARVEKATEALRQQLGRYPSAAEVAEHCGMNVEEVTEARLADERVADGQPRRAGAARGRRPGLATCSGATTPGSTRVEDALWIEQLAGDADGARARGAAAAVRRGPGPARDRRARRDLADARLARSCASALAHLADAA